MLALVHSIGTTTNFQDYLVRTSPDFSLYYGIHSKHLASQLTPETTTDVEEYLVSSFANLLQHPISINSLRQFRGILTAPQNAQPNCVAATASSSCVSEKVGNVNIRWSKKGADQHQLVACIIAHYRHGHFLSKASKFCSCLLVNK